MIEECLLIIADFSKRLKFFKKRNPTSDFITEKNGSQGYDKGTKNRKKERKL